MSLQEEWLDLVEDGMKNDLRQAIEKLLDYENFYKGLKVKCGTEEMTWNRHALMMSTDTRVCPYCERQYITLVKDNVTASCDHYYPKAQFPLLSINMYNLVPCCHICNSVFKGDKVKAKKTFISIRIWMRPRQSSSG